MEQVRQANQKMFGPKSEQSKYQMSLFDEIEVCANNEVEEDDLQIVGAHKRRTAKTSIFTESAFEEVEIIHDIEVESGFTKIGQDEVKLLKYNPAKWYVEKHVYPTYKKDNDDGTTTIVKDEKNVRVIPNSYASAEVIAHLMKMKYEMQMPLYRIEQALYKEGVFLQRATMSNWMMDIANNLFMEMVEQLKLQLKDHDIIHADETTVKVLNHQDGSENKKSYMWVYTSGEHDKPIVLYDYQPGRSGTYAMEYLNGYTKYLQCDGYDGYNKVEGVTRVGCLAHARRKFKEAIDGMAKGNSEAKTIATILFRHINYIFSKDKLAAKQKTLELKQAYRLEQVKPLFDQFKEMLLDAQVKVLKNSKLGGAITYTLNEFSYYENIFKDPRIELTNNRAERAVKPFVMGRKAWLFSNTTKGTKSSAAIYSIVQTAIANQLHVERYLTYVINSLLSEDVKIIDILPTSLNLPSECYVQNKKKS